MNACSSKVDAFVSRAKNWQGEIQALRSILLDCGLDEELKRGKPCFMFEGRNVAIIQPLKEHCSLMFAWTLANGDHEFACNDPHGGQS